MKTPLMSFRYFLAVLAITLYAFSAFSPLFGAEPDYQELFKDKKGCFILYDIKEKKDVARYNPGRCSERVFACSTFKVAIALMAFDQNILKDENTVIPWDGVKRAYNAWNSDQTPKSWLRYSTVWVSQWITPQLGMAKIQKYLADFHYGNQDMSGGVTQAWLSSTLKISADEQVQFLTRLWDGQLSVQPRAVSLTRNCLWTEQSKSGAVLCGKTGTGYLIKRNNPKSLQVGWFVGFLRSGEKEYVFATNFSDLAYPADPRMGGERAKDITKEILVNLGLY
jgi:beta-lactamase class D